MPVFIEILERIDDVFGSDAFVDFVLSEEILSFLRDIDIFPCGDPESDIESCNTESVNSCSSSLIGTSSGGNSSTSFRSASSGGGRSSSGYLTTSGDSCTSGSLSSGRSRSRSSCPQGQRIRRYPERELSESYFTMERCNDISSPRFDIS